MRFFNPSAIGEAAAAVVQADRILDAYRPALGRDAVAYGNHVARVILFSLALCPQRVADRAEKIAVAAAFHDLGIWTHGTFDYLSPSIMLAERHLRRLDRSRWIGEVTTAIAMHHKLTPLVAAGTELAEAFRRADWADVSLGYCGFGLPRGVVRGVRRAFPNAGFHRRLVQLGLRRLLTDPLDPLPMFRW